MFNPRERRSRSLFRERRRKLARRRLAVEVLEERFLLSNVYQVDLSTDDGKGAAVNSLSWATDQVNSDSSDTKASPDQIDFSIGGGGPQTIMLTGVLPNIARPVLIDGSSQPGVIPLGTEPILLDGSDVTTGGDNGLTLYYGSDGSTVEGLAISNFNNMGIWLYSGSNTITGDDIGTNQSGTSAQSNLEDGILIWSANNTIGGTAAGAGNVISGNILSVGQGINSSNGVAIAGAGATGNVIEGNDIGTDSSGKNALPNEYAGVVIAGDASGNTIGGLTPSARNVISGNGYFGVYINEGATDNTVEGNYIGTDTTGTSLRCPMVNTASRSLATPRATWIGGTSRQGPPT